MISEELEFCMEGGQVSHSWCMCVVIAMVAWVGGGGGGGGWHAFVTKPRGLVACRETTGLFPSEVKTLMISDHNAVQVIH